MKKIKRGYYFFYYIIYRTWNKDPHLLFSDSFRTDIIILATKMWFVLSLYAYLSIYLGIKIELSITNLFGFIPILLVLFTTLYFFTFSNKKKYYFKEFDKLSKRKRKIGSIVVWSVIVFIFINMFLSVELMKRLNV